MDPFLSFIGSLVANPITPASVLGIVIMLILFGWLIPKWTHERVVAAERARGDAWEKAAVTAQTTLHEVYAATFEQTRTTTATTVAMIKSVAPMPDAPVQSAPTAPPGSQIGG